MGYFAQHRFPFILPDLRHKFQRRWDQPPVPLLYSHRRSVRQHWQLRTLVDEFDPFEMLRFSISIPILIDPLEERSEQIVFVAIRLPDFTDVPLAPLELQGMETPQTLNSVL